MASKIPEKGQLICKLPASGDPDTSKCVSDLAWDQEGRLLVGQSSFDEDSGRLDRLTLDHEQGGLLKAENLHTDQHHHITSVSVNKSGEIGAVICDKGVYFHGTNGGPPTVWSPDPTISDFSYIALLNDKYCICSYEQQSSICIYSLFNRSLLRSIPLKNEGEISFITCIDDNRLVISESNTASLYLVDINTSGVKRVTPKYPGGENVLLWPNAVCGDAEGRIYVCDGYKKVVFILSPQGEYLTTLGGDLDRDVAGDLERGVAYPFALALCYRPGQCPLLAVSGHYSTEVKIYALADE